MCNEIKLYENIKIVRNSAEPSKRIAALHKVDNLYRQAPEGEEAGYKALPPDIAELLEKMWAWQNSQRVPKQNCEWIPGSPKGNGLCIADPDYILENRNNHSNVRGLSMGALHKEYRIKGIYYRDYQPDFSPCAYDSIEIEGFSFGRYQGAENGFEESVHERAIKQFAKKWGWGTGNEAIQKVRDFLSDINESDYAKRRLYLLHECVDLKTIMIVPREIHTFYVHSGGISLFKEVFGQNA